MDGEPIKMIVELDESSMDRAVNEAEKSIGSSSSQKSASPWKGYDDLSTYLKASGKQAKEALAELQSMVKKGARQGLVIDAELKSVLRAVAASMGMKERDGGNGTVRYGKADISSQRAVTAIVQGLVQQALSPAKTVAAATASITSGAVPEATKAVFPILMSPAEKKRQAKQDAEDEKALKRSERESAKQVAKFEREQARKERQEAAADRRKKAQDARDDRAFARFLKDEKKNAPKPPPLPVGGAGAGAGGLGGLLQAIMGGGRGGRGGMGTLFGALGGGGGGGGGLMATVGMTGPWGAAIAGAVGILQKGVSLVKGVITGFVNFMEGILNSLGRLNPAVNIQIRIFEMQTLLFKRQMSMALQPAMESWLNFKRMIMSILQKFMPLLETLGNVLKRIIDFLTILLSALKALIPAIMEAAALMTASVAMIAKLIASIADWVPGMGMAAAALNLLGDAANATALTMAGWAAKMKAGGNQNNTWTKYNQMFLDAFRHPPTGVSARPNVQANGQAWSNNRRSQDATGINVNATSGGQSWLKRGAGHEYMNGGDKTTQVHGAGHEYLDQSRGGSNFSNNAPAGKVGIPKAAAPRMDIKNQFTMRMDYDKMLQESVSQIRGFLLESIFGIRAEVSTMQAQLDPRGLI